MGWDEMIDAITSVGAWSGGVHAQSSLEAPWAGAPAYPSTGGFMTQVVHELVASKQVVQR